MERDGFAVGGAGQGRFEFAPVFGRHDNRYVLADRLGGRIPVYVFGSFVPAEDGAIEGLSDDGVGGGVNDGGQARASHQFPVCRSDEDLDVLGESGDFGRAIDRDLGAAVSAGGGPDPGAQPPDGLADPARDHRRHGQEDQQTGKGDEQLTIREPVRLGQRRRAVRPGRDNPACAIDVRLPIEPADAVEVDVVGGAGRSGERGSRDVGANPPGGID
jgi:hypothetical protein